MMNEKVTKKSGSYLLFLLLFALIQLLLQGKVLASEKNDYSTDLQIEESFTNLLLDIDKMYGFSMGSSEKEIESQLDFEGIFYERVTDNIEGNEFTCLSLPNERNSEAVQEDAYFFYNGILEMCMFKIVNATQGYKDACDFYIEKYGTPITESSVEEYGKCSLWENENDNLIFVSEYYGIMCFSSNIEFIENSGMGADIYSKHEVRLSDYMS